MKNYLLAFAILTVLVISCKKEDTPNPASEPTPNAVVIGKWTIDSTHTVSYINDTLNYDLHESYFGDKLEFTNVGVAFYSFGFINTKDTTTYSFMSTSKILMDLNNDNKLDSVQVSVVTANKRVVLNAKVQEDNSGSRTYKTFMTRYLSK